VRVVTGPGGELTRLGVLTFIDPNLGGSGYLEKFATRLPAVAAGALHHLDHEGCETACYRCLKSYNKPAPSRLFAMAVGVSTLEGLRDEAPTAVPLNTFDVNDPRPWRAAFEAGVASPLEHRCLQLLENAGLTPQKQFAIQAAADSSRSRDFAFPEQRLALYVDGASIHLVEVLCRDRRIEQRLQGLSPPWTALRLGRKDIDGAAPTTVSRIRSLLGC